MVAAIVHGHPTVRVLRHERNEGKGAAVRRGMLAARGQNRLFTDAAGATPIVELLLLAQAAGYRVTEVPVNWTDQPGSKVRVLGNGPGMLRQIAAARFRMERRR